MDADGPDGFIGTLDNDLRLLADSDAINAGNNNADLDGGGTATSTIGDISTDLNGNPRTFGGTVDMGVLEFSLIPPILYVDRDASGTGEEPVKIGTMHSRICRQLLSYQLLERKSG